MDESKDPLNFPESSLEACPRADLCQGFSDDGILFLWNGSARLFPSFNLDGRALELLSFFDGNRHLESVENFRRSSAESSFDFDDR